MMKYSDFSNQFDRDRHFHTNNKQRIIKKNGMPLRSKDGKQKSPNAGGGPVIAIIELPPKKIL